jgi:hypothetical protein
MGETLYLGFGHHGTARPPHLQANIEKGGRVSRFLHVECLDRARETHFRWFADALNLIVGQVRCRLLRGGGGLALLLCSY